MTTDQTPLDVEAIRARLDATSPGMTVDVHDGGSTLRATGNAADRPGFVGAVTDLVGALGGETGQLRLTFADDEDGQDATFALHAAADIRDLLDENARLNAALDEVHELWGAAEQGRERADRQIRVHLDIARAAERERDEVRSEASRLYRSLQQTAKRVEDDRDALAATVEALSARLTAKNTELDKVILEAAADKAKLAALPDLETIRRIERERGNWGLRLGQIRAELSSHLSESTDPCMDHGNEYPCDVKQALGVAPEMPRPPAEPSIPMRYGPDCEHKPEWRCSAHGECRACECGCFTYPPTPEGIREAAQEPVSSPETPGTGSGRGTGVTEASGSDQEYAEHELIKAHTHDGDCWICTCGDWSQIAFGPNAVQDLTASHEQHLAEAAPSLPVPREDA